MRQVVIKVVMAFLSAFVPAFARAVKEGKAVEQAIAEAISAFLAELSRTIGLNVTTTVVNMAASLVDIEGGVVDEQNRA